MRVLSNWKAGDPPMPGLWLTRKSYNADWDYGHLKFWDGFQWCDEDGCVYAAREMQWRGLAFDPETAIPAIAHYDPSADYWYVKVPVPTTGM